MLSVNEIKELIHGISAPFPVFLVAQYQDGYNKIKIPQCLSCERYIQVKDYSDIMCGCGNLERFKWNSYNLDHGIITEYSKDVDRELFNFHRSLPIDRLKRLYFYIKPKEQLLGINLDNGEYVIDGIEVGSGIISSRQPIVSSNQLDRYDDLFVFKSCVASPEQSPQVIWYKMGYKCQLRQGDLAIMLFVHIPTLQPYLFSEVI